MCALEARRLYSYDKVCVPLRQGMFAGGNENDLCVSVKLKNSTDIYVR